MVDSKKTKARRAYSIGEWYGSAIEKLTAAERVKRARIEIKKNRLTGTICRFQMNAKCNKKGGVCSIRLYEEGGDGSVSVTGPLVTTCPARFLEASTIFSWVGETILQTKTPIVLSQIGFLERLKAQPRNVDDDDVKKFKKFIGKIDNVLVHPSREPIDWCALELQAVYFSGKEMKQEFKLLAKNDQSLPFPAAQRHPDWRSSGPKRLLPQLQIKVPTISTWGKKMAVVIDEAFFESLVGLEPVPHLSAHIAWFIVGYDQTPAGWALRPRKVVLTELGASVKALTGGIPLPREKFEEQLRRKLLTKFPRHPLPKEN